MSNWDLKAGWLVSFGILLLFSGIFAYRLYGIWGVAAVLVIDLFLIIVCKPKQES